MRPILTLILTAILSIQMAVAAPAKPDMAAIEKAITTQLKKLDTGIPIESIKPSPMEGVYMVTLQGGHVLYTSASGKHLIRGDMMEIRDSGLVNLSEEIRSKANAERLQAVKPEEMIVFPPKGKTKAVVYAFTDVDCGYCRKLHQEVTAMNDLGIELRYLAFPRGGERSAAYSKMVDAWGAKNKQQAITDMMAGKPVTSTLEAKQKAANKAIIDSQYQLGIEMGVNGTPAMILENGQMIPGYRPAKDLAKMLGLEV